MTDEKDNIIEKRGKERKERAKEFLKIFDEQITLVIEWYEEMLTRLGKENNEMISFIALMIHLVGENNKLKITPEQVKEWNTIKYHVVANVDDDGGLEYEIVYEEDASANPDS
jgi:hypothetical protein